MCISLELILRLGKKSPSVVTANRNPKRWQDEEEALMLMMESTAMKRSCKNHGKPRLAPLSVSKLFREIAYVIYHGVTEEGKLLKIHRFRMCAVSIKKLHLYQGR